MSGNWGSIASEPMFRDASLSQRVSQFRPPSLLRQTPPPAAPTNKHIESRGSTASEVRRPLTLPFLLPVLAFDVEILFLGGAFFDAVFLVAFFFVAIRIFSCFPRPGGAVSESYQCIPNLSKNQSSPLTFCAESCARRSDTFPSRTRATASWKPLRSESARTAFPVRSGLR